MEYKELVDKVHQAMEQMGQLVDRSVEESKSAVATITAETKESIDKVQADITSLSKEMEEMRKEKARIDDLEVKMQRGTIPSPNGNGGSVASDEAKFRKDSFYKYVRHGITALTPDEQKALVEDTTGLYLVEPELDADIVRTLPTITIMRNICTVRSVGSERIKVRSLSEPSVGWGKLETGTEVTDTDMTPSAPTYQYVEDLNALAKIGKDELMDSDFNLEPILADAFSRAIGEAEEAGFVVGRGHTTYQEPEGFTVDTTLVSNTVTTAAAGAVTVEKFIEMLYQCPTQYRRNGVFVMNSTVEMAIRQLRGGGSTTNDGPFLWQPSVALDKPNTFLGKPIYTQDDMLELTDTASCIGAFGDFRTGYRIIDRAGISIQRLTELYAESGMVGFMVTKRVGGGPLRQANQPIVLLTEHA